MTPELLIDGYNLMHAAGIAKRMARPGELESWRHRLIKRVSQNLKPQERTTTVIVFDAKEAPDIGGRNDLIEGILIQYAAPGREADDLIEDLIQENKQPQRLRVVSSDHRIQKAARRRKAKFLDSDKFLDELDDRQHGKEPEKPDPPSRPASPAPRPPAAAAKPTPPQPVKPESVDSDYWMKEFGDIDMAAFVEPDPPEEAPAPEPKKAAPRKSPGQGPTAPMIREHSPGRGRDRQQATEDEAPAKPVDPLLGDALFWQKRIDELKD
jgi:predicted RNA-binding protein with PIN domain